MSQSTSILLVCPACKSRRQVPRELVGQRLRCRQCTAELTVNLLEPTGDELALAGASAASLSAVAGVAIDDIPLAPLADPTSAPPPKAPSLLDDYRVGPPPVPSPIVTQILRQPPPPEPPPPETWVKPPAKKTLGWAFLSGIFTYFLRPSALSQWLVFSVGLFAGSWFLMMGAANVFRGFGAVAGGCFAIIGFLIGLAALSYGSACFVSIIENTAYHLDKAAGWPEPDYREWLFYLLRLIYLLVLASLLAAPLVTVVSLSDNTLTEPVATIAIHLLFPILLLSVLETNSPLWPISPPILRSLIADWRAWLIFYVVSALLWTAWFVIAWLIVQRTLGSAPLLTSPLAAAAWFSYARLIGRLASYIMHLEDKPRR